MKSLRKLSVLLSGLLILSSCSSSKQKEEDPSPSILFSKSAQLIIDYSKNIVNATDSFTVDSLDKLFDKELTDINFSVPPLTDLKLAEEQNDSLVKLMSKFQTLKKRRLEELSKRDKNKIDSISS